MSASGKLHRSTERYNKWQKWTVHAGRGEIDQRDRSNAANGRFEPRLTDAAQCVNVCYLKRRKECWCLNYV
jgi:hypothetical protein